MSAPQEAARFAQRRAGRAAAPLDYAEVRGRSLALAAPLSEEDCCVQSMPDASPIKWHLAHTTWFFETFVLEAHEAEFRPQRAEFRVLFNSYYNGVGEKHPRAQRGLLTRPSLAEVREYRAAIDARMQALLVARADDTALRALVELGLQHEQQHQELMLTDIKHLLSMNPLQPAYAAASAASPHCAGAQGAPAWITQSGGAVEIGHAGTGFCFDNELPRHRVWLTPHALAARPVSNAEYARFVAAGGYADPRFWLAEGWDWLRANNITHPLYWRPARPSEECAEGWDEFTLAGLQPLDPQAPATHLAYFECDAYARWAGARLPTEAEWEHATAAGRLSAGGQVWEWTSSSYAAYPGYRHAEGAIGEYNGKFMVNQYVLRGGSRATPAGHARISYRNFFPAGARWQFSGLRLARDA